jgi:hypothetical protein
MKSSHSLGIAACAALAIGIPAHATLMFNITYTAAVQGNANFAQIQSAVNFVEGEYSALYNDNVTLNFTIDQNSSGLGQSLFSNNYFRGSYAQVRAALIADAKSPNDAIATALANLPVADPYGGNCNIAGGCWYATSAEAKALGLPTGGAFDGTYTFNSLESYMYDPNNRAVAGKFDFIGVTEHEFAELMGRTSQNPTSFGFDILDTMRFTAVGVRNVNQVPGVYFSFDNGNTHLAGYSTSGDRQDFDGAVATDPYNASTGPNQSHKLNGVDIAEMDVIGWDFVAAPIPEPSTFLLIGTMLLVFSIVSLRRRIKNRGSI